MPDLQYPQKRFNHLSKRVLLIEPPYKVKYPPLGLMKISTYHKTKGDEVVFFKGKHIELRDQRWDKIYITTLFTYQWNTTIDTIKYYQQNKGNQNQVMVGGILASLLQNDVEIETGIKPHFGIWELVDRLSPDYSLFDGNYNYYTNNASFAYMTRGCINKCPFCAVPKLEPQYIPFIDLKNQVNLNKKDLLLLDNNVLASSEFPQIVSEIIKIGFAKGAKLGKAQRYIDFNQGLDARLLNDEKMGLISQLPIKPLRIAFDDIKLKNTYIEKIELANKYGLKYLSNYILYNFMDNPIDFYDRLKVNIELNEELGMNIYSYPMKYVPLTLKDRSYIGPNWSKQQLRGIQCILHATHGVVGPKRPFFEKAFGKTVDEFLFIINQPEEVIFNRNKMEPFKI